MNGASDRQERIYGLDLYRILCMFFVIAYHFSFHGNVTVSCAQEVTFNWAVLAIARIFGALCNGGFMLTSGYFLYRKRFRARTVFRLWCNNRKYRIRRLQRARQSRG